MSCASEELLTVYADGELGSDEARRLEAHLIGCAACRRLVVSLRGEAELLADVLHERERPSLAELPVAAPARGLAVGLPLAIAATGAALAAAERLLAPILPGGLSLLEPLRVKGAYDMFFEAVFLLRDRVPGLLEFALSVAALLSVSALGSFALGALVRRVAGPAGVGLAGLLLLGAPDPGRALDLRLDRDTSVGRGEVVEETLVVTGDVIHVDGVVQGDLVAAAERVLVRGRVEGNLFVFARSLELSGSVGGAVHALARELRVDGEVAGNVYAVSENVTIESEGRVARELLVFGEGVALEGRVDRSVVFVGDWIEVRGSLGGDLRVPRAERVALLEGARVAGNVDAVLPEGRDIERDADVVVGGEVQARTATHTYLSHYRQPRFYALFAIQLAASFCFGLLLYTAAPALFASEPPGLRSFFRALGLGFLVLVAAPLLLVVIALTLVGIPIAVLGLFGFVTALYLADILVGALVGRAILGPATTFGAFARVLLLGLTIVVLAHLVPYLGPAVGVVSLLLGLGLLAERARRLRPLRA